jgi:hypothetical protein
MTEYITRKYLRNNPTHIFVYGDNDLRKGKLGAATLRDEPNTYGFVTKKFPRNDDDAFYNASEYKVIFRKELDKLIREIETNPTNTYLISKLGGGLANKHKIFEQVIEPEIKHQLIKYPNVKFLW